ncbi:MAG: glycosyltransferase [Bacteroidia bacterium]|nr:glycosyltransferase [Bacteroidia bacterium]MCF8428011.1 glycosyltransferase [Bacteroidia bacterium]MCF8445735.1 glycosyltransferase [Bacteroidia bacterium]
MFDFQNNWVLFLALVVAVATVVQVIYYLVVFSKLAFYKGLSEPSSSELKPISVLIAARNEYKNLEKNLKLILDQDYPNFEVIVINDCSWDDSQKLLEYYQEQYAHLKVCQLIEQEKYPTGKKFALTIGIKAAKNEHMVFTDADCEPASNQWLRLMQGQFSNQKEIVLGYSPYKKKNSFLNLFIRFESVFTAMAYFSAAIGKSPFMGVGRNLAYTRALFFKNKGFATHQHILSGDDDLFVNQCSTPNNVAIQIHPDSFVYSEPKTSFDAWQRQKTRHSSTGKYYKTKDKALLGAYYASHLLFYSGLIALLILGLNWQLTLGVYLFRFLVQTTIFYLVLRKLKSTQLIWFIPVLDFLYLVYIFIFGTIGVFTKPQKIW